MKLTVQKFCLFTFVLLEFLSAMAFASIPVVQKPVVPTTDAELRIKISISITIGRRRDCIGWGICDISLNVEGRQANSFVSSMYVDDYNKNIIVLEIDKAKGMTQDVYSRYFSSGTYLLEDDSPVPSDVVKQLGLSGSKTLIAGKYGVIEKNGVLVVSIPVK